jgi:hypothetical protein
MAWCEPRPCVTPDCAGLAYGLAKHCRACRAKRAAQREEFHQREHGGRWLCLQLLGWRSAPRGG